MTGEIQFIFQAPNGDTIIMMKNGNKYRLKGGLRIISCNFFGNSYNNALTSCEFKAHCREVKNLNEES